MHSQVDGFRFDIMGHLMVSTMQKIQSALSALTLERDGLDGTACTSMERPGTLARYAHHITAQVEYWQDQVHTSCFVHGWLIGCHCNMVIFLSRSASLMSPSMLLGNRETAKAAAGGV